MAYLHERINRLEPGERTIVILGAIAGILLLVIAALAIALSAQSHASQAGIRAQAACSAYKQIAEAPVSKQTTSFGLALSAAFRQAYITANCKDGPLDKVDPRVEPFISQSPH
jgi:hypothetical protein